MPKYRVEFTRNSLVHAENKREAIRKAMDMINQELGSDPTSTLGNLLGAKATRIDMAKVHELVDGLDMDSLKQLLGYVKQTIHERDPSYDVDAGYWKE